MNTTIVLILATGIILGCALVGALGGRQPFLAAAIVLTAMYLFVREVLASFHLVVLLVLALVLAGCDEATAAGPIATYAPDVIGVAFTALAAFVAKHLVDHVFVQGLLSRLVVEAKAVVLEVEQTYVDSIKAAKIDGVLTSSEAAEARSQALVKLRENIGQKGLDRLGRILGLTGLGVSALLSTHLEASVKQLTLAQGQPPPVGDMSTPPLASSR